MNSGVRSFGKFILITYTIPTVPVMSISCKIGLMSVVIAVVPLGIVLSVVIAITMVSMPIGKAHLLMTMLAIPFVIGMTIVRTLLIGSAALIAQQGL